jgi:hypothetical protein
MSRRKNLLDEAAGDHELRDIGGRLETHGALIASKVPIRP